MKILLGSKNPSKSNALSIALNSVEVDSYEIKSYEVNSGVSSKPIGFDIIRGIDNRNNELQVIALKENINFDFLCSIEGGFEQDQCGQYFIITYCGLIDNNGNRFYGKSQGFPITKNMFEYISEGKSLNKVIEEITNKEKNKQKLGITGYLSRGYMIREMIDSQAVTSAIMQMVFEKEFKELDDKVLKK